MYVPKPVAALVTTLILALAGCSSSGTDDKPDPAEVQAICSVGLAEAQKATGATAPGPRHNQVFGDQLCYYRYTRPGEAIGDVTIYVTYVMDKKCGNRHSSGMITNRPVEGGMLAASNYLGQISTLYGISACTDSGRFYHMDVRLANTGAPGTWSDSDSLRVAEQAVAFLRE